MNKLTRLIRFGFSGLVIALGLMASHVTTVMAQEAPPAIAGVIQGTGTSFAVTDSDYLNVSVVSTAEVDVYVNSAPTIINVTIAAAAGATSTDITLGGLEADTSYWMYHDGGIDSVQFTTDASGNHGFTQDLSEPHSIRIQPGQSTVYIYDDGASGTGYQCTSVGTWDATTKTCTLTQDVNDSIYIYSSGVTLDGAGFQVNLPSWGSVQVNGSNHTVKNLTINGTAYLPYGQSYCDAYGGYYCELQPTGYGVYIYNADSATVTNVTVSNTYYGLYAQSLRNSTISDNTFSGVAYGAYLYGGYYYQYYCDLGYVGYCGTSGNTLSDNAFSPFSAYYDSVGLYLVYSVKDNIITGNTISNFNYGMYVYDYYCYYYGQDYYCPTGNTVYQNNFIDNDYQIFAYYGYANNAFNLAAPDGGNYYSDFDETVEGCSDGNGDGFCDGPYAVYSYYGAVTDDLPWTVRDGWLNEPPVADASGPYLVAVGGSVALDGSLSSDPDGDALTETWTADGGTVSGNIYTAGTVPGIYDVGLVVNDGQADSPPATTTVVVYDPTGGFVTGGGWINSPGGAYAADASLTGKANFGFVSKYKKGAQVPTGNTEFQFKAGDLNLHSSNYEWLVVNQNGANAQYKGTGTVNGAGNYGFMIWAGDGGTDTFRIKIWDKDAADTVVYDNGFDQAIGGGQIIVHQK